MHVEGGGAARRQPLLDQGIELARQQMERYIAATVGVEQNEIIELAAAIEKHAAVAGPVAHALGFAQPEIGLGGGDDAGIDFHGGDRGLGHETPEIAGDRAAAQPEHEDSPGLLRVDGRDRHDLRIAQRQVVGIGQIGHRFGVVPAFDLKRHDEVVLSLGDEYVVVFGFDMGEPAARPLEHVGANGVVDQAFAAARGRRQRDEREHDERRADLTFAPRQRQQCQSRDQSECAQRERDRARADRGNEEEGGAQRADDRARGGDAVDRARDAAGTLRRAQQKADGERRIHSEQGHRKEHEGERSEQAAGADIVEAGQHEFEDALGEARQRQQIERPERHRERQDRHRRRAIGQRAAQEVARGEGDQHGRDQRRPGIDAAAEIGVEIARAQHLEAHHDPAGHERDRIDHDAPRGRHRPAMGRAGRRFDGGLVHGSLNGRGRAGGAF